MPLRCAISLPDAFARSSARVVRSLRAFWVAPGLCDVGQGLLVVHRESRMAYELKPCPKPPKRRGKSPQRKPMKRTRMKACNRKRGGSSFPKRRDWKFRRWVWTENDCMLAGRFVRRRISLHDVPHPEGGFIHFCWGEITPAHVGDTQARGAPDFGVLVPLCKAAHRSYDQRRWEWRSTTGYSEKKMASEASGYGLRYVERGGIPTQGEP